MSKALFKQQLHVLKQEIDDVEYWLGLYLMTCVEKRDKLISNVYDVVMVIHEIAAEADQLADWQDGIADRMPNHLRGRNLPRQRSQALRTWARQLRKCVTGVSEDTDSVFLLVNRIKQIQVQESYQ